MANGIPNVNPAIRKTITTLTETMIKKCEDAKRASTHTVDFYLAKYEYEKTRRELTEFLSTVTGEDKDAMIIDFPYPVNPLRQQAAFAIFDQLSAIESDTRSIAKSQAALLSLKLKDICAGRIPNDKL